jgi:hypothetical protein
VNPIKKYHTIYINYTEFPPLKIQFSHELSYPYPYPHPNPATPLPARRTNLELPRDQIKASHGGITRPSQRRRSCASTRPERRRRHSVTRRSYCSHVPATSRRCTDADERLGLTASLGVQPHQGALHAGHERRKDGRISCEYNCKLCILCGES